MDQPSTLATILDRHRPVEGALLPILNDVMDEIGAVSEASMRAIADALNLTAAEVHGVVSFYHDYRTKPAPHPVIKLCRAEACQARGVEALVAGAEARAKGRVTIETVYCLGLCSVGPAALVGGTVHARLDDERLAALIEATS